VDAGDERSVHGRLTTVTVAALRGRRRLVDSVDEGPDGPGARDHRPVVLGSVDADPVPVTTVSVESPTVDLTRAVELADRVWWVGDLLPGDRFQCHVYLIEQGDHSVLIDPGSALNVDRVIQKIDDVVGLAAVRWVVCSHADPDILGALPAMYARGLHPEARIVTHWRDAALITHTGTPIPFWHVEEHDWRLVLDDRELDFVFTPYAHFAGAFCTYDRRSRTLFSSDLFGGFSSDDALHATTESFEGIRAFHEHYMPSSEILGHCLDVIEELDVERIAPQHGVVLDRELAKEVLEQLREIDCGLYLLAREDPGLEFLIASHRSIRRVVDTLVEASAFAEVAAEVANVAAEQLGASAFELWGDAGRRAFRFAAAEGYVGQEAALPVELIPAFRGEPTRSGSQVQVPVYVDQGASAVGVAVLHFDEPLDLPPPVFAVVEQIASLVGVALAREVVRLVAERDRVELYERATRDPLTGLHNRAYLTDLTTRLCALDDRSVEGSLAVLMLDLDHFKVINDAYGHLVGDDVLRHVARSIESAVRPGDAAVRYGGEEFVVVLTEADREGAARVAERIRSAIASPRAGMPRVRASVGVTVRGKAEDWAEAVARADRALYEAKAGGRDRVVAR
jgi:diguanylate cyclase (GGDEF)-like protein